MKSDTEGEAVAGQGLEMRIGRAGKSLSTAIDQLLEEIPGGPHAPQALARTLGVDKVLTSRLLKAARTKDPVAVVHHAPGPEPLRRVVRAARRHGVTEQTIQLAEEAITGFESLIRLEVGDRSALDAIISAWLPEARRDFELRRKQSAFKAMSQLRGVMARTNFSSVLLHPSDDGEHLDVIWIIGQLGLQRLRPGIAVKVATRRMTKDDAPRQPVALDGSPIRQVEDVRLDEFCEAAPAPVQVHQIDNVVHYLLAGNAYGPGSAVDMMLAEANFREISRYMPLESGRRGNVFVEVGTPCKTLVFDAMLHEDVYPGSEPRLEIYDTALEGVADVNDRTRDIDRLDMVESIQRLGTGLAPVRCAQVPRYVELLRHTFDRVGWDDSRFRTYRCQIEYPVYGSQIAMTFVPPPPPKGRRGSSSKRAQRAGTEARRG